MRSWPMVRHLQMKIQNENYLWVPEITCTDEPGVVVGIQAFTLACPWGPSKTCQQQQPRCDTVTKAATK